MAHSNAKDSAVIALAREFRERNIPCDVFGLEPGWQSHAYSCTFTWHEGRFPNPKQFLSEMKTKQYRVNLWEHAYTNPGSPLFAPLLEHSGDKGVWGGLVPDFAGEGCAGEFAAERIEFEGVGDQRDGRGHELNFRTQCAC